MTITRPMTWSVRRELWENRSLYIAPLVVAVVVLCGYAVSTIGMPERRRATVLLEPAKRRATVQMPYDMAAMMILLTMMIVALFYCLDALYGERRDRSILFWKSLPLSDRTAVLSKLSVPMLVLPAISCAVVLVTQGLMLMWTTMVLAPSGQAATTFANIRPFDQTVILLYGVAALVLWHAPIYGWLLLVSGWARKAPFLWAVLPPMAIAMFEKITFNTSYFALFLKHRFFGYVEHAFAVSAAHQNLEFLSQITPLGFLSMPGLWLGLVFAAACIAAAVRLRRYRDPI
jgi:ABC-2 type transport system permease protein